MQNRTLKTYLCGVGAYAACLVPAMLPIFPAPLTADAALRLALAALLALLGAWALREMRRTNA